MLTFQCVTKSAKKIYHSSSKSIKLYVASLLLSAGKKNCTSMSSSCSVSYNAIYKYFDVFDAKVNAIRAHLIEAINQFATKENPGVLIVDSSQLVKLYSKKLNCLCYDFNGSMKLILKGMSCVTSAWTNGKILIPLDFDFWIREKDLKNGFNYKKKLP